MNKKTQQKITDFIARKVIKSTEKYTYGEIMDKPKPSPLGKFPELSRKNSL